MPAAEKVTIEGPGYTATWEPNTGTVTATIEGEVRLINFDAQTYLASGTSGESCRLVAPAHEWPHGKRPDGKGGMPHCCSETRGHTTQHKCFCGWVCPDEGNCWMSQDSMMRIMGR